RGARAFEGRGTPTVKEMEHVRGGGGSGGSTPARLAFVEHRSSGAPIAPVSPAGSLDGEAREPGMQGQPGACAAQVRGLTARIERTDAAQQLLRELERGRRR